MPLAAGSSLQLSGAGNGCGTEPERVFGGDERETLTGIAVSDDFNRADGGLGVNWVKPVPASENNLVIVNNQVGVDVEDSHNYAFWSADSFSQDQYSQVRISNVGPWPGVIVRAQSAIDKFYLLALVFAANDYRIYLRKDGLYYSTEHRHYGDVGGWRHYRVGGGGVEPGATDVAPEWESGFDLHRRDREPRWRQPGDRDLFTVRGSSSD